MPEKKMLKKSTLFKTKRTSQQNERTKSVNKNLKHFFFHVQKEPICTNKCRFRIFGRIQNENGLLQRLRPPDLHSFGTILLGGLKPRQPVLAEFSRF